MKKLIATLALGLIALPAAADDHCGPAAHYNPTDTAQTITVQYGDGRTDAIVQPGEYVTFWGDDLTNGSWAVWAEDGTLLNQGVGCGPAPAPAPTPEAPERQPLANAGGPAEVIPLAVLPPGVRAI